MNSNKKAVKKSKFKGFGVVVVFIVSFVLIVFGVNFLTKSDQIELVGDLSITHEVNTEYKELGFKSTDDDLNLKDYVKITNNVDIKKLGKYDVVYELDYQNKKEVHKREVEVVDTTPPVITIENYKIKDNAIQVCPSENEVDVKYVVKDNLDGDISKNAVIVKEKDFMNIESMDSSNNKSTLKIKIRHVDDIAPKLDLLESYNYLVPINSEYKEPGYKLSDNCDQVKQLEVLINGNVDTKKAGIYEVNYRVTDSSHNSTTLKRIVEVVEIDPKDKVIYLTFDDGPSKYTKDLLDVLRKYNVKASFFVVNTKSEYDFNIKQAYDDGHTVALHSYTHKYNKIYKSENAYFDDLNRIKGKVKNLTGYESNIIRFPGGTSNVISKQYNKGIMTRLSKEVGIAKYRYYDWNVDSMDTQEKNYKAIARNVIDNLKPNRRNIVLQHDLYKSSVDAVERIIRHGLKNGYTFLPITNSTPELHHGLNN